MVSSWLSPLLLDNTTLFTTGLLVCWPLPPPAPSFPQSWLHHAHLWYLTPAPCCLILAYYPSSSYSRGSSCLRTSFRPSIPALFLCFEWFPFCFLSCICMASFIQSPSSTCRSPGFSSVCCPHSVLPCSGLILLCTSSTSASHCWCHWNEEHTAHVVSWAPSATQSAFHLPLANVLLPCLPVGVRQSHSLHLLTQHVMAVYPSS